MLSLAAKENMLVHHVDVIEAFLFSDGIDADVYMEEPIGFEEDPRADQV